MKRIIPRLIAIIACIFYVLILDAQTNEWTWMKGDDVSNQSGTYGTKGVPAFGNKPGSRWASASWTDAAGNLWLFGGLGHDAFGTYNDLNDMWKYDISANTWTWMNGDNIVNQYGIYGTQGVSSSTNNPGARDGCMSWQDAAGNFWLFGGVGLGASGFTGHLNDLWKYNTITNQWTWIKGGTLSQQYGVYGTKGLSSASNNPGGRYYSVCWIDNSGDAWLFGGVGYCSSGVPDYLNDLWKYNSITNQWTWMAGDNAVKTSGVYGTQGIASSTNKPGSRFQSCSWIDGIGNLWLFGGHGLNESITDVDLNDLWKYDPIINQWTWMKGDKISLSYGVYGSLGIPAVNNTPGGRRTNRSYIDGAGKFYLFGGTGYDASSYGTLNDLWKFDPLSNQWTWLLGDNIINQDGIYGTQGISAPTNKPGGRQSGELWRDNSGNVWLFGGVGKASLGSGGRLNDLWKFNMACVSSISITASSTNICSGTSVTFTAAPTLPGTNPIYQWQKNGINVGTNSPSYTDAGLNNGDVIKCLMTSNDPCVSSPNVYSNSITMTVSSYVTPTVSISTSFTTICSGASVTFTATTTNGGSTPVYQWKKNGVNVGTNSNTYNDATLNNGDAITCILTSNASCTSSPTATSNVIAMTVQQAPSIAITASSTSICSGTPVTFSATVANGASSPSYQWKLNGINIGSGTPTYTSSTLLNGDIISCVYLDNSTCISPPGVSSNTIQMQVGSPVIPAISITGSSTICIGTAVTFTAAPTNGGTAPIYQWQKNGVNVGTNSATYTDAALNNGDVIVCILSSNAPCATSPNATSSSIVMTVNNAPPSLTINSTATNICSGTLVTFSASVTSTVGTPTYLWKLNGSNVGSNSASYISGTLANGDIITCVYTDNSSCIPASGVASNTIQMQVTPSVTPTISIATSINNICIGTSLTFTATSNIATVTYQWKKNGINVGTNSNTYTDNLLSNSDNISCVLTASGACLTSTTATSNNIPITVFPNPVIALDHTPILCSRTNLDAGPFSSYLWSTGSTARTISITSPGTYSVQVTDNNGCIGNDMATITDVLPTPFAFLQSEATINCETQSAAVSSSHMFSSYLWSTGATTSQINISTEGNYWLEVTNSDGCKEKEFIVIKPGNCQIIIPNTFTPNNDITNNLWLIKGLQRHPNCTLEVFNRYGQLLFQSVGYSTPWDGTYKGKSVSVGTYYYLLDLHDGTGIIKGYVTVIK